MCGNWKESDDYDKKKKINFFPKKNYYPIRCDHFSGIFYLIKKEE